MLAMLGRLTKESCWNRRCNVGRCLRLEREQKNAEAERTLRLLADRHGVQAGEARGRILPMSPRRKKKLKLTSSFPFSTKHEAIENTYADLRQVVDALPYDFRFIYVDDGSSDGTVDTLRKIADERPESDPAPTQPQLWASGRADGGHGRGAGRRDDLAGWRWATPARNDSQMMSLIQQGYDIVQTQRIEEDRAASFKKVTSNFFYRLDQYYQRHTGHAGRCGLSRALAQCLEWLALDARISPLSARHDLVDGIQQRHPAVSRA
jgi:hypothetical protein